MEDLKRVKTDEQTPRANEEEVTREFRDLRPAHYLFKINNFSLLLSYPNIQNYESSDFEVAGYKWKLRLHLGGKEKGFISLYLVLSTSNSLPSHQKVNASFKLFVYNQVLKKYLTVQDGKES
ncbi:hypothetical protein M5689_001322 [Euphorbia peplus]|nr:hypothetical protein M5689_001322 [Euphorbia peplus]